MPDALLTPKCMLKEVITGFDQFLLIRLDRIHSCVYTINKKQSSIFLISVDIYTELHVRSM